MKIVYLLKCPLTQAVRYVGEGDADRPRQHVSRVRAGKQTASPRLTKWIASLLEQDLLPLVEIVETGLTKEQSLDLEEALISKYGRSHLDECGTLLNIAQRGKYYDKSGEKNPFFGKTHSEETLKKMSEAKMGKSRPDEFKEKMRAIAFARPAPSEANLEKRRISMLAQYERKRQLKQQLPE